MNRRLLNLLVAGIVAFLAIGCSKDDSTELVDTTPRLNKSDSLALVKIYQEIGPWHSEWDLKDITTWCDVRAALDLSTNQIRVIGLEIYGGRCKGTFPKEVCELTELRRLAICGGEMGGSIPEDIGRLKNLILLRLGSNNLTGGIPESIGELTNLMRLDIVMTDICDTIPESIGNLVNLEWIFMYNNKISGNLPKGLARLTKLQRADFHNNQLSGTFPIEITEGKSPYMQIDCKNNNITELPFEIWDDSFNGIPPILQGNRLSGDVPEWVTKTDKWKHEGQWCTDGQQEGYGYSYWLSKRK